MSNSKEYYIKNREKLLKYGSQWQKDNPEKIREYVKKWKKNNPEKVREQRRQHRKRYRERENKLRKLRLKKIHEWINNYKLSKGCAICGYNKCAEALDFHHTGDKDIGIARLINKDKSIEKIKKEIDKCVIRCANCHRELHAKEKSEMIFS